VLAEPKRYALQPVMAQRFYRSRTTRGVLVTALLRLFGMRARSPDYR